MFQKDEKSTYKKILDQKSVGNKFQEQKLVR